MRRKLTPKAIDALEVTGRRYDVLDAIVPGLAVRVTETGHKSFVLIARFRSGGSPTRRAIASVGSISLERARETARQWLQVIGAGLDPKTEAARERDAASKKAESFRDVAQRFLDQHVRRNALRSEPEIERILKRELYPKWGDREFVAIRRGDVARLLDEIEERAPVMADRVLSVLSKLCNWYQAREEDYLSPIVRGMRRTRPSERARNRTLADEEIKALWAACREAGTFGAFVQVALLTGQRRKKVAEMRWVDISPEGVWIIPSEAREKANAVRLKLPPSVLEIVRSQRQRSDNPFVFAGRLKGPINGFSKVKLALDRLAAKQVEGSITPWTVHDLRRTAKSLMVRAGVRPDISERVLGHAIAGVEGVYDRYSYDREKGEALKKLAALIAKIIAPAPDNVIALEQARG